jgi:two-component system cell cycle sensor histidine kinase/response regulator CckA
MTILIVDDDPSVRRIVELVLKTNGFKTISASNGLEALMIYSSYRVDLDLVLTDIDMPQMNGIELAVRIRVLDPAKKILMMSGGLHSDAERKVGCPLLAKPFRPDQLVDAVNFALGR